VQVNNLAELAVNFDLESDLLMALESISEALLKVKGGNHSYLKWAVIFGHTALQSAMCLSLITSASFLVRKRTSYKNNYGELDNIEWLYQKLQNTDLLPYVDSKIIPKNALELKQIKNLQTIRNTFIHQQPALYVYTFEELIESIGLTVKLTRFLVSSSERMALGASITKVTLEQKLGVLESQLTSC